MSDEELDALVAKMRMIHEWKLGAEAADTITALRAKLAEVQAERDVWEIDAKRNHQAAEIEFARADRAETALAAQVEDACAVIDAHSEYDQSVCCDGRECGCQGASVHDTMKHFIRQSHDRTALDRMLAEHEVRLREAREKALREAYQAVGRIVAGYELREDFRAEEVAGKCHDAILALIEEDKEN